MQTVRLTMAQALVRYLAAQFTEIDGQEVPLIAGGFAIFGHGNVTCLSEPLQAAGSVFPTWRGQNEQSMALAAVAYAKAMRRRRFMFAASSIGPGATNMVTAAGVAHANRLPVLLLSGDTFAHRLPDPVLQQVEHFGNPSITVNDAFRAVTRYWDRITRPSQLLASLPQALAVLLDPAECGPAFLALPQDVQSEAYDYPVKFFERQVRAMRRPHPDPSEIRHAAAAIRAAKRPLLIAGGGVHYSQAEAALAAFAERHRIPVAETIAGRAALPHAHACNVGSLGGLGAASANAMAAEADLLIAVGTRLQDFSTGSWALFENPELRIVTVNAARFDATKHMALPVVADARVALDILDEALEGFVVPEAWAKLAESRYAAWNAATEARVRAGNDIPVTYAQTVGAVNRAARPGDTVLTAAGGLPGELNMNWRAPALGGVDIEFGYSCMGYEIAGGWGAKLAEPRSRGFRDGGRRQLSVDELRHPQHCDDRAQADHRRVRQRRLRGDRPATAGERQCELQQPAVRLPARARREGGFRRPRARHGRAWRAGGEHRRPRRRPRPRPRRRPDLGDRDRRRRLWLDAERGMVGSGCAGGERAGGGAGRRGAVAAGTGEAAAGRLSGARRFSRADPAAPGRICREQRAFSGLCAVRASGMRRAVSRGTRQAKDPAMSISLFSALWQPASAALSAALGGGSPTSATTSGTASSSGTSATTGATVANGGISNSQIASELQAILLQLQETGATSSGGATTASLSGSGTSRSTDADGTDGTGAAQHHHHHHRAHEAGGASDIASQDDSGTDATNPTQLSEQIGSAG